MIYIFNIWLKPYKKISYGGSTLLVSGNYSLRIIKKRCPSFCRQIVKKDVLALTMLPLPLPCTHDALMTVQVLDSHPRRGHSPIVILSSLLSTRILWSQRSQVASLARSPCIQHAAAHARRLSRSPLLAFAARFARSPWIQLAAAARVAMDPASVDSTSEELAPDSMEMRRKSLSRRTLARWRGLRSPSWRTRRSRRTSSRRSCRSSCEMEMVPDSLPPGTFVCGCCHLIHQDREAWNRAYSRFWPCSRCGLMHADYLIDAIVGQGMLDYRAFLPTLQFLIADKGCRQTGKASVRITKTCYRECLYSMQTSIILTIWCSKSSLCSKDGSQG